MEEYITVSLPVDKDIKNYVQNSYLLKGRGYLTRQDPLGIYIISQLKRPPKYHKILKHSEPVIEIKINVMNQPQVYYNFIDTEGINNINDYLRKLMRHDFFNYMTLSVEGHGIGVNQSIHNYITYYELTRDEMTFDALQKAYYRLRRKVEALDTVRVKNIFG
jgi:hypothetical protein